MRLIVVGDDVVLKQRTASLSGTEVSSVDSKGINRGPCEAEGCGDCDKYIHDPVKGAQCQYCGCFPTKHRHLKGKAVNVLDTKTENVHSSSEIHIYDNGANMSVYDVDDFENMYLQTDRESPLQDECGPNPKRVKLQNLSGTPSGSSAPQQECTCFKSLEVLSKQTQTVSNNFSLSNGAISKMSREEKYEFCVPTRLPLNKLSPSHANNMSIVKWISWSMWNMNITSSEDFFNVARLALKRYPVLLSTSSEGRGPSHLVRLLKKSLGLPTANNNEETSGKPKKEDPPKLLKPEALEHKNLSHYNQIKVHIQKEMQKPEPSLGLLRSLLSSCRKQRKVLSQINSYSMLMDELPCLQIPELLLWDFIQQEHLNCSVEDLKTRWLNALPKMASYFSLENPSELSTFDDGQTSVNVLRCLTSSNWFGPNQSAKVERKDLVLEVFESNILPIFVFPQNGDPPRLFMMGNSDDLPTCVYVEGKPVYKGHIVDALVF